MLQEYCRCFLFLDCGLIVHPDAPLLGALPDVSHVSGAESFGLVSFRACNAAAFCGTLVAGLPGQRVAIEDGKLVLPADPGRAGDLLVICW